MSKNENNKQSEYRPPIVTVMGHVDHGKTSILDAIRNTKVQEGEYGGITQHIGAYQISHNDNIITFIDTPGHAAFTQMRARGGKVADIVVLVVAADSGVQPQTKEAIQHAKSSGATIIVVINKMDLAGADSQRCKQQLAQENILVEDWGGEIVCVEVSAKQKTNLDGLLDAIQVTAEMLELKSLPNAELEASIIEAKKDRQRGVLVTGVIRSGTLRVGDKIQASGYIAKVRSLTDYTGKMINSAGPSTPVEILGFKDVPNVGDLIVEEGSELAFLAVDENREEIIGKDTSRVVSIVLKADTQGTLEAVKASLAELLTSGAGLTFSIKFLLTSTGDVNDNDIAMARNGDGLVLGFNVKVPSNIYDLASDLGVIVRSYQTIYGLIDEVAELLEGTALSEESKVKGRAEILKIFKLPSGDFILGCSIELGRFKLKNRVAIYDKSPVDVVDRIEEALFIGEIKKIKTGKDEATEAKKGMECGLLLKPVYEDAQKGMWIEVL